MTHQGNRRSLLGSDSGRQDYVVLSQLASWSDDEDSERCRYHCCRGLFIF
jgi:hypothetical protein